MFIMGSYKVRRKQSKYRQILKNEFNIEFTEEPSQNLMVGNAGLVSGVQYEQLAELFTKHGSVEKIVMIPNKSYSFIVFSSVDESKKAYNAINGQVKLDSMDGPMYLLFTETVPTEFDLPKPNNLPEGLTLLQDFVTSEEEEALLKCVSWNKNNEEAGKTMKHRMVKHYGYEFRYGTNDVDKDSPLSESIPQECSFVNTRLAARGLPLTWSPDQLTVNQYQRGQGIPSHVDTHSVFESPILSLSLSSDVVMDFRRGSRHVPVLLPRRSLLIMDGEARYAWSHGITPRTLDVVHVDGGLSVCKRECRTSFTLRRLRHGECCCDYPSQCDSQRSTALPHTVIPDHQAGQLEQLYVHQVYSNIASHFSETRTKVWPNVRQFLDSFPPGSVLLDVGCGNGKYFGINPHLYQLGLDRSEGLAGITGARGYQVFVSDCLTLPLRDSVADGVISVAVIHHLATRGRRVAALQEMSRVLMPGGRALVTAWARDQTRRDCSAYLKQDRKNRRKQKETITETNKGQENEDIINSARLKEGLSLFPEFKLPVHTARTEFQHQDVFVPWKVKSKDASHEVKEVFFRYYHVFEEDELPDLCRELTGVNVLQAYYTEGNWCIVFEKVKT